MRNGAAFEFTFTNSGTFDYHCIYHLGMDGTIVVR
jgi:plastocyanin